jgi:hypothetical protein
MHYGRRNQVVYTTFQMYLRASALSGAPCLAAELDNARRLRFGYAVKLVRCAPASSRWSAPYGAARLRGTTREGPAPPSCGEAAACGW